MVGFATGGLLLLLRLQTKRIAEGFYVKRSHADETTDGDEFNITIEVINSSPFEIAHATIFDNFHGTSKSFEVIEIQKIRPFSKSVHTYTAHVDSGAGEYGFDPIKCVLNDSLKLTEATVLDSSSNKKVQIFPRVKNLPTLDLQGVQSSVHYGILEVATPSVSVNFTGIREYNRGDPLKHISWRLSAKHQHLVVKEFEKQVNLEVNLIVDMLDTKHSGVKSDSTWETAKNLSLSLVSQMMQQGNSIQIFSQKLFVPFGRGEAQSHFSIMAIGDLEPTTADESLLKKAVTSFPKNSTVLYVTPCFIDSFFDELATLEYLTVAGHAVHLFLIEPNSYVSNQAHSVNRALLTANATSIREGRDELLLRELTKLNIKTYWLTQERDLASSVLRTRSPKVKRER